MEPPYLREDLAAALDLPAADCPGAAMILCRRVRALEGEVYRAVASRQTLRFVAQGRGYFLKRHGGRHDIYANPANGKQAPVPRHPEIKESLCKLIRQQLEIAEQR